MPANGFVGQLFNISQSGGATLVQNFIEANTQSLGSPAESHQFVVACPTVNINENIFQFVVLAHATANGPGSGAAVSSTINSATYEISADGGAALITFMNNVANTGSFGSPPAMTPYVQSLTLTRFENLPMCTVVMSD